MAYKLLKHPLHISQRDESTLMNAFPVPFRFVAIALLSTLLVVIGILNLRARTIWTDPSDGVFWAETKGTLRAETIDLGGPGSRAGIETGDRLVTVNGQPISNIGQYSDLIYQTKPGAAVTYILAGDKGTRTVTFQLGSKVLLTAKDGLRTLLAFLYLGIGVFVLFRGDRLPRTFHFYILCLSAFVVFLFSYTPNLITLDWWVYGISILAFILLPALFLHFCLRFPVEVMVGSSRLLLLYFPAIALIMLRLLWFTGNLASLGLPRTARSSAIIDSVELIYFCAGFIIGGALLLRRRIQTQDLVVRQQLKWISYGTLAGVVPFSLIYVIPVVLGARATFAMDSSILFLGLIPLSMGYALIRYRLMDVDLIARRSAAYFIASSFLLTVYLLFVLILGRALQWAVPQADFMAICFAVLVIALLFAPLRNTVQTRLDRLFYKDQFEDRATLLDFARTLSSEISLAPLSRSIVERISKTFLVDTAAVFLSDQAHNGFFCNAYALNPQMPSRLYREEDLVDRDRPVDASNQGANHLNHAGPALVRMGLHYMQDLRHHGRNVGMIALGQLPQGSHFSTEDLDLLSGLAGYAAMALENANLYRSVESKALELERLKAYTENILESINVAVLALDAGGHIRSCNRAFEDLHATTRNQIVGSPIDDLFSPDIIQSMQSATGIPGWDLAAPANIFKMCVENRLGKRLIVNLSLIPLQPGSVAINSGCLLVMDDITEKIQLEDQLMQAEKLSSIGLLAAGIAHEVNTPIAGISSYTQMLLKETPESDTRKLILEKIERQTFRAAEIVNGLLNFSRMNGSEFKDLDINQLIDDSLALLNHQLQSSHIRVDSQYAQPLPPVHGNAGKLQQVFVNLFLNARDAMPSGGELTIRTAMNETMVIVDVSDTGAGIPEQNIKRIFDPFFTTKDIGRGTGLGLAVTYGIIQDHGGRIFVDSRSGKGTHFRVKLPTRLN
jgi:two-component system NtrC family sensor kinase